MSFDLRVSLYNVKASGRKDYLAVGEDMLPTVYMVRAALLAASAPCATARMFMATGHAKGFAFRKAGKCAEHACKHRAAMQLLCLLTTDQAGEVQEMYVLAAVGAA